MTPQPARARRATWVRSMGTTTSCHRDRVRRQHPDRHHQRRLQHAHTYNIAGLPFRYPAQFCPGSFSTHKEIKAAQRLLRRNVQEDFAHHHLSPAKSKMPSQTPPEAAYLLWPIGVPSDGPTLGVQAAKGWAGRQKEWASITASLSGHQPDALLAVTRSTSTTYIPTPVEWPTNNANLAQVANYIQNSVAARSSPATSSRGKFRTTKNALLHCAGSVTGPPGCLGAGRTPGPTDSAACVTRSATRAARQIYHRSGQGVTLQAVSYGNEAPKFSIP